MAYLLSSERPAVAAAPRNAVIAMVRWLAKARAERAQQRALADLLHLDDARLEDLGLSRDDVRFALGRPPALASLHLSRSRARRASLWLGRISS